MKISDVGAVDREVMLIAQEECAEVTQAISKVFRFGFDSEYDGRTKLFICLEFFIGLYNENQ